MVSGVIGTGDIARVLPLHSNLLFFASGVSDSQCTDEKEYDREVRLLMEQDSRAHIVYFSSLAVMWSDTRYFRHKKYMETLLRENFSNWTIIRLGNIDFGSNPRTLINYLRAHPEAEVRDEWRYICSKEELLHWIDLIPSFNVELNIPGQRMKVVDIKEKYCAKK
jgi:UDP-2-acetamido-2,6-beta-L-arabino-hexul-4-ose reductase